MMNVLAFFGAFNPPTRAHLELADFARQATGAEGVVFIPSRTDYIRNQQGKDSAFSNEARLEMLNTLAESRPWMLVSGWELQQAEQPRSYITLCHLREEGFAPSLLLGSDNLQQLSSGWKYVPEIAREFGIVCLARNRDSCGIIVLESPLLRSLSDCITILETPDEWKEISSSAVREVLRKPQDPETLARMIPGEIICLVYNTPDQRRNNP